MQLIYAVYAILMTIALAFSAEFVTEKTKKQNKAPEGQHRYITQLSHNTSIK